MVQTPHPATQRDLDRERLVVDARAQGLSWNRISRLLNVSPQRVQAIYKRWEREQANGR